MAKVSVWQKLDQRIVLQKNDKFLDLPIKTVDKEQLQAAADNFDSAPFLRDYVTNFSGANLLFKLDVEND